MNLPYVRSVKKKLLTCFSQSEIAQQAMQCSFTCRERVILPTDFIMTLISALGGDGNATTLADLHRKSNELPDTTVTYRSWCNQAKKAALRSNPTRAGIGLIQNQLP